MSLHSWPGRSKLVAPEADTRSDKFAGGKGLRTRIPREKEGTKAEREFSAFKSRAGYIGALTKARKQLETCVETHETLRNVSAAKEVYDNAWRNFIDSHEKYISCLESEEKKKEACLNYEELMGKKVSLDGRTTEWITRAKEDAERRGECVSFTASEASLRTRSINSSRSSVISKKRELLALAQLKVRQLTEQQDLERKLADLQHEKAMIEAKNEAERAMVSLNVYKGISENNEDEIYDNENEDITE